jgi:hypothetical protein
VSTELFVRPTLVCPVCFAGVRPSYKDGGRFFHNDVAGLDCPNNGKVFRVEMVKVRAEVDDGTRRRWTMAPIDESLRDKLLRRLDEEARNMNTFSDLMKTEWASGFLAAVAAMKSIIEKHPEGSHESQPA